MYLYITYYYTYSNIYLYPKYKQYIKHAFYDIITQLNTLLKSIKSFFICYNTYIIIFFITIFIILIYIIVYYVLVLFSLLFSLFSLDFFLLKFIVLLLLFVYESAVYLIYNFYFSIIISTIYLNYEAVFYFFNEFF